MGKKALTSISPWDGGLFLVCVCRCNELGCLMGCISDDCPRSSLAVSVSRIQMTPESSSHLVLLPFSTPSPFLFALEPY